MVAGSGLHLVELAHILVAALRSGYSAAHSSDPHSPDHTLLGLALLLVAVLGGPVVLLVVADLVAGLAIGRTCCAPW